jgi:hypothetical protein
MSLAAPSRAFAPLSGLDRTQAEAIVTLPEFVVPILPRSAMLLNLLLQDEPIDLELASAIVALDPGLAFAVLQLANPIEGDSGDSVWQFPEAIVTTGREELQRLVNRVPRVNGLERPGTRRCSPELVQNAAVRACVAYWLARALGRSNPRKGFLGGLLLDLPQMVSWNLPPGNGYRIRLLSVLCHCLPSSIVKAMMADGEDVRDCGPTAAITFLANASLAVGGPASRMDLAALPAWQYWPELDARQRSALLESSAELASWARASVYRVDPWEFMSRMERRRPWE